MFECQFINETPKNFKAVQKLENACKKVKAGIVAPLYLSISWVLTVSYQLFTDTAVKTIAFSVNPLFPSAGAWLNSNVEVIVFVYAFTWISVLSSVIPSLILGKERSILPQYILVLALTLLAFFMEDILALAGFQIQQLLDAATFLKNPLLAGIYLSLPYILMIGLDLRSRRERKKKEAEEPRDRSLVPSAGLTQSPNL